MNAADAIPPGGPVEQLLIANRIGPAPTEAPTGPADGLLARFLWSEDRYMHRIEINGTPAVPVMQTVLREPAVEWPEDPPMQQLSIERLGEQTVALGVGSAGTSHWSLSIEAIPGPSPALRYDLACRCHRPPSRLGSTFKMLAPDGHFVVDHEEQPNVIAGVAGGAVRIIPEPSIGPTRWEETDAGQVLSIAADLGRLPAPGTFRWGFRIVWQPPE